ncbi:MAG: hypothetical protein BWY00_00943 [Firmicutes bacterium ADurb.Bin153]|nr:MAG: hypothetical protein BWY00_00943 [Firmicutes bacterium ADurb.Bin153]
MPIGINEIRSRAIHFIKKWQGERRERAEAQTFWNEFFEVFGIDRRRHVQYEKYIKKIDGKDGFIDVFWKGVLLIEHKSLGLPLDRAYEQVRDYIPGLKDDELPKFIMVSDFHTFKLYDLLGGSSVEFELENLSKNIDAFGFMSGYRQYLSKGENPVNVKAAEAMGRLHDKLKSIGYSGHNLEVYMVRLLFCLFADDASIFSKSQFYEYIDIYTRPDGSDLAGQLAALFQTLNTPVSERFSIGDATLDAFPYINGHLFDERLPLAKFDAQMRQMLLDCCALDWGLISPAIFGAMFQSVMDTDKRRALGAHYTSEENIMKVIRPLFLDDLYEEFEKVLDSPSDLINLRNKLGSLRFLDPACGCGNFLVLAYREIRKLEIEINKEISKRFQLMEFPNKGKSIVDVNQFYGIEIEEFPAQIAQVALWLMDHQMNMLWSAQIGQYYARLPLITQPNIKCTNALRYDWYDLISPLDLSYILGNPPFSGARVMSSEQKDDMLLVFHGLKGVGNLDYVAAWYRKSMDYIKGTKIKVGLVSTNSITQGEQVCVLWKPLLEEGLHINFAHRTFKWSNEAKNKAAVYCVIIGFSLIPAKRALLFDYADPKSEPICSFVKEINPYLVDAPGILIMSRTKPLCDVPQIETGNQPIDDGNYLFTEEEMDEFIKKEPLSARWFRSWVGADELINGCRRYCLWLGDCPPDELRRMPAALERVNRVVDFRRASKRISTLKLADTPTRFQVETFHHDRYIAIPETSSESRYYIPISMLEPNTLASNAIRTIPSASSYIFGILTSAMHMAWVRAVGGRLKSDYRYSKDLIYNNFPWPNPTSTLKKQIEDAAGRILEIRSKYPNASLADLYDPTSMPPDLKKAHVKLDRLVDKAYGKSFRSETQRVAHLMELYSKLANI